MATATFENEHFLSFSERDRDRERGESEREGEIGRAQLNLFTLFDSQVVWETHSSPIGCSNIRKRLRI